MNSPVILRPYTPEDKAAVVQLLRLNTPAYFAPEEEADLLYYLDHEAGHYFVISQDQEILGCGGFNFSEDGTTGKISWDIFHPGQQGKGLGRQLTQYRIDQLKTYPQVQTISVRTSQLAFPFYEKLGFVVKETVKDYWASGFDLYRMEYQSWP